MSCLLEAWNKISMYTTHTSLPTLPCQMPRTGRGPLIIVRLVSSEPAWEPFLKSGTNLQSCMEIVMKSLNHNSQSSGSSQVVWRRAPCSENLCFWSICSHLEMYRLFLCSITLAVGGWLCVSRFADSKDFSASRWKTDPNCGHPLYTSAASVCACIMAPKPEPLAYRVNVSAAMLSAAQEHLDGIVALKSERGAGGN